MPTLCKLILERITQKKLYLNLSTLSPYISGPISVKILTPLNDLISKNMKVNKGYIVSCTNSRSYKSSRAVRGSLGEQGKEHPCIGVDPVAPLFRR